MADAKDVESGRPKPIAHWKQVTDQAAVTPEIQNWPYKGSGSDEDPYVVVWIDNDPRNPMGYSPFKKWGLTLMVSFATLAVAFVSSAYSGGADEILQQFQCSREVYTLGLTLFVLGFAIGPLLWAPMSEIFGRQVLFVGTYGGLTAFNAGAAGSQNIWTLLILRFFAGAIGSSPLTNAGGVIADMFSARDRGVATTLFAAAPFMGPVLGPIVGGFVGETIGWRWVEGIMAIFTGTLWILGSLTIPETYPPVLLRRRAERLSQLTGQVYRSQGDIDQGKASFGTIFRTALSRPWILLFREPIVFLLSLYMAIIYGTLYMLFAAYPIVYQEGRGWSPGIGGLAFLGVAVGMMFAIAYAIFDNRRYARISDKCLGFAPPEARLPLCMIGSISLPIGLFWFAWTNSPSIHFMASISAGVPFGFGMVLVFLAIMSYLIDAYTIFAASVLAANSVLRSIFGAVFPLFTTQMYDGLGIHWASCIPAFLALVCVPFPFLFYKYGAAVRKRCKYSAEAQKFMMKIQNQALEKKEEQEDEYIHSSIHESVEKQTDEPSDDLAQDFTDDTPQFEEMKTENETRGRSGQNTIGTYEANPYDLDRVNTKTSFKTHRSRSRSSKR